jgi:hypothetical protein
LVLQAIEEAGSLLAGFKGNARFVARMQNTILFGDGKAALEQVARIDVHEDRLAVRLKSADEDTSDAADKHWAAHRWR